MRNNQPSSHLPSVPSKMGDSHQPQQQAYTQMFQCHCSKLFNTLDEYQVHLTQDNHDNYLPSKEMNAVSNAQNINAVGQEAGQVGLDQNLFHHSLDENHRQNQHMQNPFQIPNTKQNQIFRFPNINNQNHSPRPQNNNNQHFQHIFQANPTNISSMARSQDKELNFKYVQTYYKHKMNPFYRQFDIEPIQNQTTHRQKLYYAQRHKKMHRSSPINPEDSIAMVRENAFNDQKKINDELEAKIWPIQQGFIQFIQIFKENTQQFNQIAADKRETVEKCFSEKRYRLGQLVRTVYLKEISLGFNPNENKDFIETNILQALDEFVRFLLQKIRFSQIPIVQSITIIIMDTLIDFYEFESKNHGQMDENLKVTDLPYFYANIQTNAESKAYDIPFQIDSFTMTQFLTLFSQWCSVMQYINNKMNVDFVELLMDQLDQINEMYRQNVMMYQKSTKRRRVNYMRRVKRKMIEKRNFMKRENQPKNKIDMMERFQNWGIKANIRKKTNGEGYELIPSKQTNKSYASFSNQVYPRQGDAMFINKRMGDQEKDQKRQFGDRMKRISARDDKDRSGQQGNSKSDDNNNESDDGEASREFVPKQSQYVNYFSDQMELEREKNEDVWQKELNFLNEIIQNSSKFKSIMKEKVSKQLKDVNVLSNSMKFDSKFYYHLRSHFKNFLMRCPGLSTESIVEDLAGNDSPGKGIDDIQSIQGPFLVIKDYRHKSQSERRNLERRRFVQGTGRISEFQLKSNQFISEENLNNQERQSQKYEDPFDALI